MNAKPRNFTALVLIGTLLAVISAAGAQNSEPGQKFPALNAGGKLETIAIESETGLQAFLDAFVTANNARDVQKIKTMIHPKFLAAAHDFSANQPAAPGQTKPSIETMFFQPALPLNHPPFIVQRYLKDSPLPQAAFMDWPVRPTHEVQVSFESTPHNITVFRMELVREGDQWHAVGGLPNAEFIRKFGGGAAK